jgi:hypothetical protein
MHGDSLESTEKDRSLTPDEQWKLSIEVARYEEKALSRSRTAKEAEAKRHKEQLQDTLEWICAAPKTAVDTHTDRCEVREKYPETCDWIVKNDSVDNWLNVGTPTHSILWINGSMGAGIYSHPPSI